MQLMIEETPFRFVRVEDLFPEDIAQDLYERITSISDWKFHQERFFSQFECGLAAKGLGGMSAGHLDAMLFDTLQQSRRIMEDIFSVVIGNRFSIVAHKLTSGQHIDVHTDSPRGDRGGQENLRLVVNLNRNFTDAQGGHFVVASGPHADKITAVLEPRFNSAVGFEMHDRSYHAVRKVAFGERFSLVFSLRGWPWRSDGALLNDHRMRDKLVACLRDLVSRNADMIEHSGGSLLDHLFRTFLSLSRAGEDEDVCFAGLYHSAMGRETRNQLKPLIEFHELAGLIGTRAAEIVRAFTSFRGLANGDGADEASASGRDAATLFRLNLANILEQDDFLPLSSAEIERCLGYRRQLTPYWIDELERLANVRG